MKNLPKARDASVSRACASRAPSPSSCPVVMPCCWHGLLLLCLVVDVPRRWYHASLLLTWHVVVVVVVRHHCHMSCSCHCALLLSYVVVDVCCTFRISVSSKVNKINKKERTYLRPRQCKCIIWAIIVVHPVIIVVVTHCRGGKKHRMMWCDDGKLFVSGTWKCTKNVMWHGPCTASRVYKCLLFLAFSPRPLYIIYYILVYIIL